MLRATTIVSWVLRSAVVSCVSACDRPPAPPALHTRWATETVRIIISAEHSALAQPVREAARRWSSADCKEPSQLPRFEIETSSEEDARQPGTVVIRGVGDHELSAAGLTRDVNARTKTYRDPRRGHITSATIVVPESTLRTSSERVLTHIIGHELGHVLGFRDTADGAFLMRGDFDPESSGVTTPSREEHSALCDAYRVRARGSQKNPT